VEKVQKLNRYAMQLFDDLNFALAEKTLLEALGILEKNNLASAPPSLSTHGNLAVLYSVGLKNPDRAVAEFKKALAIKPDLKMSKQRATPETETALARARAEMGGAPAPVAAPKPAPVKESSPEPRRSESGGALKCPDGGEIQAGDDVTLKCLSSGVRAAQVTLFYKPNGSDEFKALPMAKGDSSGGTTTWTATIPGADTNSKWVPMYFEAKNDAGTPVASSGRADSPNVITVRGGESGSGEASPRNGGDGDEEGEEEGEGEEEIDDNNPLARLENERRREREGSRGTWTFAGGVGSGFGYAAGNRTEAFGNQGVQFKSGLAPAYLGHAVIEIGYFIGRNTAMTLTGRHQWVAGSKYGTATGAHSGLLRFLFFTEPSGKVRWYYAISAGGGEGFRLRVNATVNDERGNPTGVTVQDTVRGGPYVVSPLGGGMTYRITKRLHWTVDTQLLFGIPKYSTVLDLTTGIRWMH
jgi:hypothetical protein